MRARAAVLSWWPFVGARGFSIAVQAVRISVVQAAPRPPASDVAGLQTTESSTLATPVPVRPQGEKKNRRIGIAVRGREYPVVDIGGC